MVKIFDKKDISIMCPNCGKFLLKADRRDTRENQIKCRRCGKLITYVPSGDLREIKEPPERTTASGMRFF
mgnify:CR=1 FL=1|jgi:ribosomal protein S27E